MNYPRKCCHQSVTTFAEGAGPGRSHVLNHTRGDPGATLDGAGVVAGADLGVEAHVGSAGELNGASLATPRVHAAVVRAGVEATAGPRAAEAGRARHCGGGRARGVIERSEYTRYTPGVQ